MTIIATKMNEKNPEETTLKNSTSWMKLPQIKSNGLKRTIAGLALLAYLGLVVYIGPSLILLHTLIIQLKCFDEIINIAYNIKKVPDITYFRTLHWYFLIVANYFFAGETFSYHLEVYIKKYYILHFLVSYHRFISFCLYFAGLLWFMMLVRKNLMRRQFSLLFWTHFLIIIIALQSHMVIENLFEGIVWLILPLWLVILNDVFAYVFGKLYGKTPLISLSPKKTVEGFILGGLSTFVLGTVLAHCFCLVQYLVCPIKYVEVDNQIIMSTNCTRSYLFEVHEYPIGGTGFSIHLFPFIWHHLALSVFASIIAPFGGFCASGFKRAVKVKDFGDMIPGHGGMMDRFDCQFLMATFMNVYISTFVKSSNNAEKIFQKFLYLNDEKQLEFFNMLQQSLARSGYLNNTSVSIQ